MSDFPTRNARIDPVLIPGLHSPLDVLRLDLVHPVISGNKWFKLKYYIGEAIALNREVVLTFGGAFSNHIIATAAAARRHGLQSIGIIRGERPVQLSHTLQSAIDYGMELYFVTREAYAVKKIPADIKGTIDAEKLYIVNEGGYGSLGAKGASEILELAGNNCYTHILAAVGTGTMLAGLTLAAREDQQVIGISVLKNNHSLEIETNALLPPEKKGKFTIAHAYHSGGYAKYNEKLIAFMNNWFSLHRIPSDFVYTGKLFYGVAAMASAGIFPVNSKVLVIHSGGLQGNYSLPKGTLIF